MSLIIGRNLNVFGPTRRFGDCYAKLEESNETKAHGGGSTIGLTDEDFEGVQRIDENFKDVLKRNFHWLYLEDKPLPDKTIYEILEVIGRFKIAADKQITETGGYVNKAIYNEARELYKKMLANLYKSIAIEYDGTKSGYASSAISASSLCEYYVNGRDGDLSILSGYFGQVCIIMQRFYHRTAKK